MTGKRTFNCIFGVKMLSYVTRANAHCDFVVYIRILQF